MQEFPRTIVGGISMPRLIVGTNWMMGWSHTTEAKDQLIRDNVRSRNAIADILEVFFRRGMNAVMGPFQTAPLCDGIEEVQQRTGVKAIIVSTPTFTVKADTPAHGFDMGEVRSICESQKKLGATFCMPHQCTTDALVDRCTRRIRRMDQVAACIREYGMIPGLSTHMPESITYADESGLDVETYIQIYNAYGFMMQIEVDWVQRIIRDAKKPVMTIKPLAAGHLRPLQGLTFVWNTLRSIDMVTIGCMSPREAEEVIEMSLAILDHRVADVKLQETRSKQSVKAGAKV